MASYINKLPSVFQTTTEKKFFDATVDQLFSKKDSDILYGYIGQRIPGQFDPINDFYIPEPTKNRTWWQLEATAFARNEDNTKSNIFFYEDLLNRINYNGGNIKNQARLFDSEYYSWAPPIDYDMFINYQHYFWVDQGTYPITIEGLTDGDINGIIGSHSYTTPTTANPPDLTLSTGMTVIFYGSSTYPNPVIIENLGNSVGNRKGIQLVPIYDNYEKSKSFDYLSWDGSMTSPTGATLTNNLWDALPWDVQPSASVADYITMERGCIDRNSWSISNKWFHIDVIRKISELTGLPVPPNIVQASRPIIQFIADLELYKSGKTFKSLVDYGFIYSSDTLTTTRLRSDLNGKTVSYIYNTTGIILSQNQTVCFLKDTTAVLGNKVNQFIYSVSIDSSNVVSFVQPQAIEAAKDEDIISATQYTKYGMNKFDSYYYNNGTWDKITTKTKVNQEPLFNLYDRRGVALDDAVEYNGSNFKGNKIFSYSKNTSPSAFIDPVLKFPIVYTSLGQASDILFTNNVYTDRYAYGSAVNKIIPGYYYYNTTYDPVLYNSWNMFTPTPITPSTTLLPGFSKQRIIDRYVVGYGSLYEFKLSTTPNGYPSNPDITVSANGVEIENTTGYKILNTNGGLYVDLTNYIEKLLITNTQIVVEIQTYTLSTLVESEVGYFEIPQQLRANPLQEEVSEISGSDATQHFASIIKNQTGATGEVLGVQNNYRDSYKNRSVGSVILQNVAPALKSMLISSNADLDIISAIKLSQGEYTKFKNKYLSTAYRLINEEFTPTPNRDDPILVNKWVDEIIKRINLSKEFSDAFSYSYMIASGTPFSTKEYSVPIEKELILTQPYIDLSEPTNALYVYKTINKDTKLLTIGIDYEIVSNNNDLTIKFNNSLINAKVSVSLYKRLQPAYIPSTPSKVGLFGCYIPKKELDTSYTKQTDVIIGHDGSKTVSYGDYRDTLLLELETRIYNLINNKFRADYSLPLCIENVRPGYYRKTDYTYKEYLRILEPYLNSWATKNKANYRVNDFTIASAGLPADQLWKLYNYSNAKSSTGVSLNLPGNWKGIFLHYYDTINPDTRPWEMLGFSTRPEWWTGEYGTNYSSTNIAMWDDIENGLIRQGNRAIFDPYTGEALPQDTWKRSNLIIPVNDAGIIKPIPDLFNITIVDLYKPFSGFDDQWKIGDGSPVEQAWMSTSEYRFTLQEILYLTKPAQYSERMFDALGTEKSPGHIVNLSGKKGQISFNWQIVQNDLYGDSKYHWIRPKNSSQYVHGENINGNIQVRFGYQRWISDNILYTGAKTTSNSTTTIGSNISTLFGNKVRTLGVNLANKLAGFTNKGTSNVYMESVSANAKSTNLSIPAVDFDVILHKGQPIKTYSYSGIIIRARADGAFSIYGYDLLNSEFKVLNRTDDEVIDITIGGTPSKFRVWTPGESWGKGEITRYNGVFYLCNEAQTNIKVFNDKAWQQLKELPTIGGVSIEYRPISDTSYSTIPYGSVLKNAQEVFDVIIGWGAYLESQGWKFDYVNPDTNILSDWLYVAKQYLFWLNTSWAPDSVIQLSPAANSITLEVESGYPDDIKNISNGVYSTLNKHGSVIPIRDLTIDRFGKTIAVQPKDLAVGGIYFMQIHASETEHILIFNNNTSFGDVIYNPLLQMRQQRLRFNGFRTNNWFGKQEAPGYLIIDDKLMPNYDTIVNSIRYHYDSDIVVDNRSIEEVARHLIGFESKSYLDNLQISNNSQYLLYQGSIRQKGTTQAINSLFRSDKAQNNEVIDVYEEWALKLGNFGNNIEQVSTEFILNQEIATGEVIVSRMNFVPSKIGTVSSIKIFNAEHVYSKPPNIVIDAPTGPAEDRIQATAYAVLDSNGLISRIDMVNHGGGYTSAPNVNIVANPIITGNQDKLYAVWKGDILRDTESDNIIDIDIDDVDSWIVRPPDPAYSLIFPTTDQQDFGMPNAGYVNYNDVKYYVFNNKVAGALWGTELLNPVEQDTIWVANTFTNDWNVYKLTKIDNTAPNIKIYEDAAGILHLLLKQAYGKFKPQAATVDGNVYSTDYGNLICLQTNNGGNYLVGVSPGSDANPKTPWENPDTYTDPIIPSVSYYTYILTDLEGIPLTSDNFGDYKDVSVFLQFNTLRFTTIPQIIPTYIKQNDLVWADLQSDTNKTWSVQKYTGTSFDLYRSQQPLIDSSLFESAQIYQRITNNEIVSLPVYDPFKKILPAVAKQNLSYILHNDPAKYNITDNLRLYSDTVIFGQEQIGKLWWDLSTVKYMYYEQPPTVDEIKNNTYTKNLEYRRDNWGKLFPGSVVNVYEWVSSTVPPSLYKGSGAPRDVNSYVQIITSNNLTNTQKTTYYFWVLNSKDKPNIKNRTLSALDVSQLLQSPAGQKFAFFAPLQQTSTNNSYLFYSIQNILAYQGNNIQVKYKLSKRDDQPHAQWKLFREKDTSSIITAQFWDRMVDSLCGYTDELPITANIPGSISYNNKVILPVPNPSISEEERYGISIRPQQSMFSNVLEARRVFVQSANSLLSSIPIRDENNKVYAALENNKYCSFVDWFLPGYENVKPTAVFSTINDANAALLDKKLLTGSIIEIINGAKDANGINDTYRYELYTVAQAINSNTQVLVKIGIEGSALKLFDSVYSFTNKYELSTSIRQILNLLRKDVFIDKNLISQNSLYFSMLNYVFSEQKLLNWAFKTSYVYIKEKNKPLSKSNLYAPNQIGEIIEYITDNKPYHTKIRDYTSVYDNTDVADGYASEPEYPKKLITLEFSPKFGGPYENDKWDSVVWDYNSWDVLPDNYSNVLDAKNISPIAPARDFYADNGANVGYVELTNYTPDKREKYKLYPYTFSLVKENTPTVITPTNIIAITYGDKTLKYGQDYYAERNLDGTYTVYFFQDVSGPIVPIAHILWDGGPIKQIHFGSQRTEIAHGTAADNFVVNVDTCLMIKKVNGVIYPLAPWGNTTTGVDPIIESYIIAAGGNPTITTLPGTIEPLLLRDGSRITISYKQNLGVGHDDTYRNSSEFSGVLVDNVPAPTGTEVTVKIQATEQIIKILTGSVGIETALWINGERITYTAATVVSPTICSLLNITRGTLGTSPMFHTVGATVWLEVNNVLEKPPIRPNWDIDDKWDLTLWDPNRIIDRNVSDFVWNAVDSNPDKNTEWPAYSGKYRNIIKASKGGLWYADTDESKFLKEKPGMAVK